MQVNEGLGLLLFMVCARACDACDGGGDCPEGRVPVHPQHRPRPLSLAARGERVQLVGRAARPLLGGHHVYFALGAAALLQSALPFELTQPLPLHGRQPAGHDERQDVSVPCGAQHAGALHRVRERELHGHHFFVRQVQDQQFRNPFENLRPAAALTATLNNKIRKQD